jgi:hypothetical protein
MGGGLYENRATCSKSMNIGSRSCLGTGRSSSGER